MMVKWWGCVISLCLSCYLDRVFWLLMRLFKLKLLDNCIDYFVMLTEIYVHFQDIELSKEINDSFKQSSQARIKLPSGIELSVHVLTTGWALTIWSWFDSIKSWRKSFTIFLGACHWSMFISHSFTLFRYWPTYPPMDVRLPHELNVYQVSSLSLSCFHFIMFGSTTFHGEFFFLSLPFTFTLIGYI